MMDQLIPVMNRLQDVLISVGVKHAGIDLPQIVVVGAQSVGKSSVLESLVGRDFLPRGTGIVTRRPLLLQLRHRPGTEEWGEFGHIGLSTRFEDFDQVRKEIERETERITGRAKLISPLPITLKIYSPHVIDLTLVDLPGITKVPVGDQPLDIEFQVRSLLLSFITKPNCIILAVTAANTDLANSDALQLAREVDPEGMRTLGVITKCDMMDEGTDAVDMLMGKIYPLKKGYVGVVCRSQRATQDRRSIRDSLKDEEKFFRTHPSYRSIAHRCGTHFLSLTLNQILMYHIRDTLPALKSRIHTALHETELELQGYGDPVLEAKGNPGALLLHFFSKFARNFQDCIDGTLSSSHSSAQLTGGARINYIFHDWYSKTLMEFYPLQDLSDHEIRTAIRNCTGPKAALFVPEGAFEILVKKQIMKLEPPSLQCVDQVYEELQNIVERCELVEMSRFSNLRDRILEVVRGVLKRCLAPANQMIQNLVQLELAYINTNHPDFMGAHSLPHALLPDNRAGPKPSDAAHHHKRAPLPPPTPQPAQLTEYGRSVSAGDRNRAASVGGGEESMGQEGGVGSGQGNSPDILSAPSNPMLQQGGFFSFLKGSRTPPKPDPPQSSLSSCCAASPSGSPALGVGSGSSFGRLSFIGGSGYQASVSRVENSSPSPSSTSNLSSAAGWGIRLPPVPGIVSPSDHPSQREIIETELIKSLIDSYFCIVRKTIIDAVPKAIMYFMVNTAKEVIQRELVSQLYREELFGELLKEADDIAERRAHCKELRKNLQNAADIVSQIRDYSLEE